MTAVSETSRRVSAEEIADRVSVGLLVLRGDSVCWLNPAARDLVAERGLHWSGPGSKDLIDLLVGRQVDAGTQDLCWTAPDGSPHRWRVTCRPLHADTPAPALLYEIVDETAPPVPVGQATDREWRLARLEALTRLGSWEWDVVAGDVIWSEALLRLFGFSEGADLDYLAYRSLLHPDDVSLIEDTLAEALRTGAPFTYTHRMYLADRVTERVFECYGEVIMNARGEPVRVLGTAQDITEQHRTRQELTFLAGHDPLTGLANRRQITDRLTECVSGRTGGALLLIDVDNFKDINDLRGHPVGDQVMRALARLLSTALGPDLLLGRLGGDEFAVVLPRCEAAKAVDLAERLCDTVACTPIVAGRSALTVTASIGVAVIEPDSEYEVALAHADLALYEAKNAGRNRVRLFATDQYQQAARRVSVLQRIGDALTTSGLHLEAQPIIELRTGTVARHELLVRLRDGREPVLEPDEFLPAAERSDLVLRLDRWVIGEAVRALAEPAARTAGLRLEVNVSGRSLDDPALGEWILTALRQAQVEPQRLGLEITETAAITSLDAARPLAMTLIKAGCGFSLDDFGAGFGSFSYLKHLPFTAIKIAGDFVRQVDTDAVDRTLVDSVVRIAHQLGMDTVAEHVDRPALVGALHQLGVDHAQGFHLGRPRPLDELLSSLSHSQDRP
ncbi:MAG: putative bifunctional diguanylate cyclase/phosphodiesterase [Pseudonocardia sp.]